MSSSVRLIEVAHASHTGRVRTHNEDRWLVDPPLVAVADGVGGANAGEVAAQIAIDAVADLGAAATAGALRDRLIEANTQIRNVASDDATRTGMGTTMTAALLGDTGATIVHVGDSRAYLWRDGELRQLTEDHSLVGELVRRGQLSSDEAARHPSRNVITRALGAEQEIAVDELHTDLRPDDVLLLCSDGLSSMVDDAGIGAALAAAADPGEAGQALLDAALVAGGADNVTIVLCVFAAATEGAGDPVITAIGADATAPIAIPPAPTGRPKPARTPAVLEQAPQPGRPRLRTALGLAAVLILLLGAFGAWIGSRTYFVDGEAGNTVRVYHGAPLDILGVSFFAEWGDTGVPTQVVATSAPDAIGRDAHGKGEAVRRAVDIVWTHGLPTIPEIAVPAQPAPTPGTAVAQTNP